MTRFDDELDYLCAWGRWRIGQALNEPVCRPGEPRGVDQRLPQRSLQKTTRSSVRRGPSRLRLVTDAGRPVGQSPRSIR
jgi:hypothetical protein